MAMVIFDTKEHKKSITTPVRAEAYQILQSKDTKKIFTFSNIIELLKKIAEFRISRFTDTKNEDTVYKLKIGGLEFMNLKVQFAEFEKNTKKEATIDVERK